MITKVNDNKYVLKSNSLFLKIGIVAIVMEAVGLYIFIPILSEPVTDGMDYFGFAFLCLWLFGVLLGAVISFYTYSKKLVIDDFGVAYSSLFGKKHLSWNEIKDYGLSYDGRSNDGGHYSNSYIVYFASSEQKKKNEHKRKLSKDSLKAYILSEDYRVFTNILIPFCVSKTDVIPFVPREDLHFV